jgi:sterol desaturase/sphingolipid hydroxylase (fatty acid hydroxylase superfamily)
MDALWSSFYHYLADDLQLSQTTIFVGMAFALHGGAFWSLNILLYACYHYSLFPQWKINSNKYPDRKLVIEALKSLVVNHLLMQIPSAFAFWTIFQWRGMYFSDQLPQWHVVLLHIFLFTIVEDTLFYWSHRLLHHPLIYKHIHKQHHKFKATIGIASEYAHPVEAILSNVIPSLAGPFLVGQVHVVTFWLWLVIRVVETVDAHSGYDFPLNPFNCLPFQGGPERHDYHHMYNVGSFGSFFTFWDWVMGSDQSFKNHKLNQKKIGTSSSDSDPVGVDKKQQ